MPGVPHEMLTSGNCRVDSATTYLSCPPGGTGTTLPEQFVPYRPDGGLTPIQTGEELLLKSEQTGLYCRVVSDTATGKSQILCDQPTPATATPLTYTATGFSYNGRPLITDANGGAYLGAPGGTGTHISLRPVTPALSTLTSGSSYNLNLGSGTCYIQSVETYVVCPSTSTSGKNSSEQFVIYSANQVTGAVISSGSPTLIRSVRTGLFCRSVTLPGGQRQIMCDVADAAQASSSALRIGRRPRRQAGSCLCLDSRAACAARGSP
jgi:hypothetical protein